jgi:hypothetical protein
VTINLKGKIEKWIKDREAEDLASKAFWKMTPLSVVFSDTTWISSRPPYFPCLKLWWEWSIRSRA